MVKPGFSQYPSSTSAASTKPGTGTAGGSDVPEGPPCLYPPLNIPEPYVGEKKRAVVNSILRYRKIIEEARARHLATTFKPNNNFHPPNFSAGPIKVKRKFPKKISESAKDEKATEEDADTEEEAPAGGKPKAADDEDADVEEAKDSDDEETAAKSDSDIDDYTANDAVDDDEMNFDDAGGEAENDNQIF